MTARVQIEIEAQDNASGVLRAIAGQFGSLGGVVSDFGTMISTNTKFMGLYNTAMKNGGVSAAQLEGAMANANAASARFAETLVLLAINTMRDSINATMEYAAQVRDLSLASGTSAEEASRLIQVLDDYEITASEITTATRFLTKNGLEPNIETIAKLSDEYVKLNSPLEKNRFIMENLGRGGMKWANALSQGGDALRELNAGVSDNLILTEEQVRQSEIYRLSVDNMSDAWQGFQITIGNIAIEPLSIALGTLSRNIEESTQNLGSFLANAVPLVSLYNTWQNAAEATAANQAALDGALQSSGEAASEASTKYADLVSMAERLNAATDKQIRQAAYQDLKAKLKESGGEITDAEAKQLEAVGLAMGIIDQKAVYAAAKIDAINKTMVDGGLNAQQYAAQMQGLIRTLAELDGMEVEAGVNINTSSAGLTAIGGGRATGTAGQWATVPAGYPNDSYTVGLTSGERYMVQTPSSAMAGDTFNNSNAVNNYYGNNTFVLQGGGGVDISGVRI